MEVITVMEWIFPEEDDMELYLESFKRDVTEKVTEKVTAEVTAEVTKEITAKKDAIIKTKDQEIEKQNKKILEFTNEKTLMVKRMLRNSQFSKELISDITGMSIEEIIKIESTL